MGIHRKKEGKNIIKLVCSLGQVLGYHVLEEEKMGTEKGSQEIDITWRKDNLVRYPLFIFEVESDITKSATDNVTKVFSKPTTKYHKPLFFFHIFVNEHKTNRLEDLSSGFDKSNYKNYVLNQSDNFLTFLFDVIDQHSRVDSYIDLIKVVNWILIHEQILGFGIDAFFEKFALEKYDDIFLGIDFRFSLEKIVAQKESENLANLYINYLNQFTFTSYSSSEDYQFLLADGYGIIIHSAIIILFSKIDETIAFKFLRKTEKNYAGNLWNPMIGISEDADLITLSEFPLILTLLSCSFKNKQYSKYFSEPLLTITKEFISNYESENEISNISLHCLTWLLVCSKISSNKEAFNYAKNILNERTQGIDISFLKEPSIGIGEIRENDKIVFENPITIPDFEEWNQFINLKYNETQSYPLLKSIINSFLQMNITEDVIDSRRDFANYCLMRSLD